MDPEILHDHPTRTGASPVSRSIGASGTGANSESVDTRSWVEKLKELRAKEASRAPAPSVVRATNQMPAAATPSSAAPRGTPQDHFGATREECERRTAEVLKSALALSSRDDLHPIHVALVIECQLQIRQLQDITGEIPTTETWSPSTRQVENGLTLAFQPFRPLAIWTIAMERRESADLMSLISGLERARTALRLYLEKHHRLEVIQPIPGRTVFEPSLHEDNAAHRLPASDDPSRAHNIVYEQIRPGFRQAGKVLAKAYVKRYVES